MQHIATARENFETLNIISLGEKCIPAGEKKQTYWNTEETKLNHWGDDTTHKYRNNLGSKDSVTDPEQLQVACE